MHLSTEGLLLGRGTCSAACAARAEPCVTLVCVSVRISALTSELGLCLELDDQPAILADVDADYLQPGREHAVCLDPCKDSGTGSSHSTLAPHLGSASPRSIWEISKRQGLVGIILH